MRITTKLNVKLKWMWSEVLAKNCVSDESVTVIRWAHSQIQWLLDGIAHQYSSPSVGPKPEFK